MGAKGKRVLERSLLALTVLGFTTWGVALKAADHADSPDTSEGNLDINDTYAFNQGSDVVLVMTVAPFLTPGERTNGAALNPRGLYEFKLDKERDGIAEAVIQVATSGNGQTQNITVRGPVAPETQGTTSRVIPGQSLKGRFNEIISGDGMTAWAGPSDDPFFINISGDKSVRSVLNSAYGAALGMQIGSPAEQTLAFENPAADDFAGLNLISIVVQVPKSKLASALGIAPTGTFYFWGTTSVR
jgi:hypothetical protein